MTKTADVCLVNQSPRPGNKAIAFNFAQIKCSVPGKKSFVAHVFGGINFGDLVQKFANLPN